MLLSAANFTRWLLLPVLLLGLSACVNMGLIPTSSAQLNASTTSIKVDEPVTLTLSVQVETKYVGDPEPDGFIYIQPGEPTSFDRDEDMKLFSPNFFYATTALQRKEAKREGGSYVTTF